MDGSQTFVELFAGVGGFRLALEAAGWSAAWSNQWEPLDSNQWASRCYSQHFGNQNHSNRDILSVPSSSVPRSRLLVAGFPCQDFSIANSSGQGLRGERGQLWWEIVRIVASQSPDFLLFENVDRLLRSPGWPLGIDFWTILHSLCRLGYKVEWRVVNAANFGFAQRRRRVFIFAALEGTRPAAALDTADSFSHVRGQGVLARAFPADISNRFVWRVGSKPPHHFGDAGVMNVHGVFAATLITGGYPPKPLVALLEDDVRSRFYVEGRTVGAWTAAKGPKSFTRRGRDGVFRLITEGQVPFPDNVHVPSRTILTNEGSHIPNRTTHVLVDPVTSRLRLLTPTECERLNGFPDGWTESMPAVWRYRCMGNALIVGNVSRIGEEILAQAD